MRRGLTGLMADVLRKQAHLTVVAVTELPLGGVAVAGEPLPAGSWGGRLIAYVTQGTNDESELAAFVDRAFALLGETLGPSAAPCYVAVQPLPAAAWGYDGRTQLERGRAVAPA